MVKKFPLYGFPIYGLTKYSAKSQKIPTLWYTTVLLYFVCSGQNHGLDFLNLQRVKTTSDHMGYILKIDQREILRRLVTKPESRFSGHIQNLLQIVETIL